MNVTSILEITSLADHCTCMMLLFTENFNKMNICISKPVKFNWSALQFTLDSPTVSAISWREHVTCRWDNDIFVDQHA